MKKLFLLLMALHGVGITTAQLKPVSFNIIPRFETISVNDGLSQSSVYTIFQDSKGYMWFGTADGINRYDGQFNKVYKVPVTAKTPANSNYIRGNIVEDKRGNIWYSTETGLFVIDRLTDQIIKKYAFKAVEGFSGDYPLQFIVNDSIWFVHKKEGVGCYSIAHQSVKMYPFDQKINAFVAERYPIISAKPFIWYNITGKKGIYEFNCETKKYKLVFPDSNNVIYYKSSTSGGSFLYNGSSVVTYNSANTNGKVIYKHPSNVTAPIFRDFVQDNYQRIWMATMESGIYMYDLNNNTLHHFEHKNSKYNSLSINFTNCLYIDRSENLWIGTDGGGVCKIDLKPSKFDLFPQNEGDYPALKDYFIKCFYEDEHQNIWFGTHNNGLCMYNPTNQSLKNISHINGKPLFAVGDIFKDANGNIWIGHGKGVAIYNKTTNQFTEIPLKLWLPLVGSNIFVYKFIQRKNGDILAATAQKILQITKTTAGNYSASILLSNKESIPSLITDIKELSNGDIIIASPSLGFYLLDSNLNEIKIKKRLLKGIDLRSIVLNKKEPNHIWLGSGVGLFDLNIANGNYVLYNKNNGIGNEYIYGIIEDNKNNLWLSTNGGISCFNLSTKTAKNFTANDGLQSNEFNTGAYYKGASGNIYFGGIKGFNWFNPQQQNTVATKPQVDISVIKINDDVFAKPIDWWANKTIRLPYYKNDVSFTFSALDFTKPEANIISYQLINWDERPIITTNKDVNYNNLPPGEYMLKVKCRNSSDEWSDEDTISIIIQSPFWNTWWFYTLTGFVVFITVVLITKFYTKQKLVAQIAELKRQRELDEERQRISREMHDDIGAGLTQITLMTESAKRKKGSDTELENIAETSRKLVSNMSEIVWSLNPENRSLDQLLSYLREQLHKLLEHSGIEYAIHFPEIAENISLQNNQNRNILLITKEITNNAIKYSQAKNIIISCIYADSTLTFGITDDGIGFDTSSTASGNGLKNITTRIEALGGILDIQSGPNRGTTFNYKIPL